MTQHKPERQPKKSKAELYKLSNPHKWDDEENVIYDLVQDEDGGFVSKKIRRSTPSEKNY